MTEKKVKRDPLLGEEKGNKQSGQKSAVEPGAGAKVAEPVEKLGVATPPPAKVITAKDTAAETKAILEASPHVNFVVPLAEGEAPGAFEEPQINGYKMIVEKGVMKSIPIQVAKLLAEKYRIALEAGKDKRLDQAPDHVKEALG